LRDRCIGRHVSAPKFCHVSVCRPAFSATFRAVSGHVSLVFSSTVSGSGPLRTILVAVLAVDPFAHAAGLGAISRHVARILLALPHFLPVCAMFTRVSAFSDGRARRRGRCGGSLTVVHFLDHSDVRIAQLFCVSYNVEHAAVFGLDSYSAIAGKGSLAVMHDGVIII